MCSVYDRLKTARYAAPLLAAVSFAAIALAGCERRERVLEIRTPRGDVTVDRVEKDDDTRKFEVEATER